MRDSAPPPVRSAPHWLQQLGAVWCYGAGAALAIALGVLLSHFPAPLSLDQLSPPLEVACGSAGRSRAEALTLYAGQARWLAFAVLLVTVAAIALATAFGSLAVTARERPVVGRRWPRVNASLVGSVGLVIAVLYVLRLQLAPPEVRGFLSGLLQTTDAIAGCGDVRSAVWFTRSVGEGVALFVGAAMCATAAPVHDARVVAERIERLQLLLYCASLLFVAGILMSEHNFSWISAQWLRAKDEATTQAIADVIRAGTLQSGVAYSALLVVFFLPARAYLASRARKLAPQTALFDKAAAKSELQAAGLVGSWRDDLKQILALLAPLLSAPLFDAIGGG